MNYSHLLSVLPDESVNQLIQAGVDRTRAMWTIGDIRNYLAAYIQDYRPCDPDGVPYTIADIDRLAGMLAGVSDRRVRDYAAVCARFPESVRAKYDALPFAHFEFALTIPGVDPYMILDAAMAQMDKTGHPPSVEWLRYNFRSEIQAFQVQLQEEQEIRWPAAVSEDDESPYSEPGGQDEKSQGDGDDYTLRVLVQGAATMLRIAERAALPKEIKQRIVELLRQIAQELEAIRI